MEGIFQGKYSDIQIAGFLVALEMKGVTIEELTAAVRVVRANVRPIFQAPGNFIDIMSTGGSAKKPFNVSTTAMFIAAGAGVQVAKHTQRSIHTPCGSSDVLEALGVNVSVPMEKVPQSLQTIGLGVCFSPLVHPSMKFLAPSRRSLGIRTLLDLLAPMSNPTKAKWQVIGVHSKEAMELMASSYLSLGRAHVMLIHGKDGMDEITTVSTTYVIEVHDKKIKSYQIAPEDFAIKRSSAFKERVIDPNSNAKIIQNILQGQKGKAADIALLNSAAVIYMSGRSKTLLQGLQLAKESLYSGKAHKKLQELITFSQSLY